MKKIIALITAVAMLMTLCCAAAEETQLPVVGTWGFIYAVYGESSQQLSESVTDAYVLFNANGTFRFHLKDSVDAGGTYTDWENIKSEGYDYAYILNADNGETLFCILQSDDTAGCGYFCDVIISGGTEDTTYMFVGDKVSDGDVVTGMEDTETAVTVETSESSETAETASSTEQN